MSIRDKLRMILEGATPLPDKPTPEFVELLEKLVHKEAPLILKELKITSSEWDYKKNFSLYWEGPERIAGKTAFLKGEKETLANIKVFLFVKNIMGKPTYDNFAHNFIHTMAHEFKHVQQFKHNDKLYDDYINSDHDFEGYKAQHIEKEANDFAAHYMKIRT